METGRRTEMRKGLVLNPHVEVKSQEKYLSCRSLPWGVRYPSPTSGSPAEFQCRGKKSPQLLDVKTNRDCGWNGGLLEYQMFLLNGLHIDLLADRLTRSELQCWGSSNQGSIKIGGPTQPTKVTQLQQLAQVTIESVPLGATGYLRPKVTLLRPGDIAALLNT